jgi:hypothetical protein
MLARLTQVLASSGSLQGQAAAELDDVVGDNDNADPINWQLARDAPG